MAKNHHLPQLLFFIALCLSAVLSSGFLNRQPPVAAPSTPIVPAMMLLDTTAPAADLRSHVLQIARAEIGITDQPGRGADRVAEYLAYTHLGPGYEWCAAFVSWCFGQAGLEQPRTPWSPALFPRARQLPRLGDARPGDVFGLWIREKGRIGHAGFIESIERDGAGRSGFDGSGQTGWAVTVEGNNRHAVRRVRRPVSSLHVVADWISRSDVVVDREGGEG